MTLVLIGINRRHAVQISDRRLVSNGAVVEEEHEKGLLLLAPDARFVVSFTGLARLGRFEMRQWLLEALAEIGSHYRDPTHLIESFTDNLNCKFDSLQGLLRRIPEHMRLLQVGFVGYFDAAESPIGLWAKVTNQRADASIGRFEAQCGQENPEAAGLAMALGLGCTGATTDEDFRQMQTALIDDLPAHALRSIMTRIITKAADGPRANGMIGKQLDYIHLPARRTEPCTSGQETAVAKAAVDMPRTIYIGTGGSIALEELSLSREPGGMPAIVPRVRRNQPCPCGSGQRYRECHGALKW